MSMLPARYSYVLRCQKFLVELKRSNCWVREQTEPREASEPNILYLTVRDEHMNCYTPSLCVCQPGRYHGARAAPGLVDHGTVPKGYHSNGSGSRQGCVCVSVRVEGGVCVCVCVGPVWWAAGCELSRSLAGLELSGQQEKQVEVKKASFILFFLSLFFYFILML